jgi:predicted dehydrogenase
MRGYPQEMEDFINAIIEGRDPISSTDLAYETVEVIYAAYLSAETGKRIELAKK